MKKLRSLFLAAVLIATGSAPALLSSTAHADSKSPSAGRRRGDNGARMRRNQMEMMSQYLGLTNAQKAKIKPIMERSQQRSKAVRADKSLSPEQKRSKMRAIREDSWKKINPILTAAQRKKIGAMRQNMRQHHRRNGSGKLKS